MPTMVQECWKESSIRLFLKGCLPSKEDSSNATQLQQHQGQWELSSEHISVVGFVHLCIFFAYIALYIHLYLVQLNTCSILWAYVILGILIRKQPLLSEKTFSLIFKTLILEPKYFCQGGISYFPAAFFFHLAAAVTSWLRKVAKAAEEYQNQRQLQFYCFSFPL